MPFSDRLTNAAAILATVIGTFQMIGSATRSKLLDELSHTFAISPAPSPFTRFVRQAGPEGSGAFFGCEDQDGRLETHRWTYGVRGRVAGPHRRIIAMMNFFELPGLASSEQTRRRVEKLARYYFCDGGPIARAAYCPARLRAIHFPVSDPGGGTGDLRIACSK